MKTSEFKDIDYKKCNETGIVTLKLNTPARKNALSPYSFYELFQAVDAFEADDSAHAMVITGAVTPGDPAQGEAFSSGGYFNKDALEALPPEILAELDLGDIAQKRTTLKLFLCDKPILAAVNGYAIGGAATLILAVADQIFMSEHAWMQLPFAKLGISAELASSFLLPRVLGLQKAKQILFYADKIDAAAAFEMGLISGVVAHEKLLEHTYDRARKLIPPQGAPLSIRAMKRLLNEPLKDAVSAALDRENAALNELFRSNDFKEGVAARVEKRAPRFTGS